MALPIQCLRSYPGDPLTYRDLVDYQNSLTQEMILLAEVDPVITVGRRTRPESIRSAYPVLTTDRGGLETYHGPGQWVVFPTIRVENRLGDARRISTLTSCLLMGCVALGLKYGVKLNTRKGAELGVWNTDGEKVVSLGIRVQNGFLKHGVAFNVFQVEGAFQGIHPCGLSGVRPGFLSPTPVSEPDFLRIGFDLARFLDESLRV